LVLKRASASRPSGEWNDDDFDVLADGGARDALRESGPFMGITLLLLFL
jgi:hypothetical protein